MPKARFLAPWHQPERLAALRAGRVFDAEELAALEGQSAIYHCVSRIVDRRFVLFDREKEKFVALMRRYEEFSQVRVLAFCVMTNHFHVLVEIPSPPPERGRNWSDEEFLHHLSCLYSPHALAEIRWQLGLFRKGKAHAAAVELRERFLARMWDLSEFMKGLKQSFSRWFNKVHERHGTLWEERFKSVLAEDGFATQVMAAYIDLNPVRAGIVQAPKDYRWSSYGEAMAGKQRAREGIHRVMQENETTLSGGKETGEVQSSWRKTARLYRGFLFASLDSDQAPGDETSIPPSEVEALNSSVRQFTEGLVVGLAPFINRTFQMARHYFGPKRLDGARKMRGIRTDLRAMRDLRSSEC